MAENIFWKHIFGLLKYDALKFTGEMPINVSLKFSGANFPADCSGDNMIICRDALVEEIANIANITEGRLSPLRLETGT